jgi:dolichyl-phosphate beta-glucosyltransferase
MDALPKTVVVIPSFNEARRLNPSAFKRALVGRDWLHLLFVNDGSTDETASLLERLRSEHPDRVTVLELETNRGKAEAVRRGLVRAFEEAPEVVGYWDADLSTPLHELDDLLEHLVRDNLDLVLGSRVRLLGRSIERTPLRHLVGRGFATMASVALRLPVYDTQCGAKLLRATPELAEVLGTPFRTHWVFDVELLARLHDPGRWRVAEHPLGTWHDVAGSKIRPTDALVALVDLAKIFGMVRKRGRR